LKIEPIKKGYFFTWIMVKFKKAFNSKIISFIVSVLFLFTGTLYPCPLSKYETLRIPSSFQNPESKKRIRSTRDSLSLNGNVKINLSLEEIKRIHDMRSKDQRRIFNDMVRNLKKKFGPSESLFMTKVGGTRIYKVSLLKPIQPHLFQTKIDVETIKKEIDTGSGLPMIPIIVLDFGREKFVADGHHRVYLALKNGDEMIEAFTIKFKHYDECRNINIFYEECLSDAHRISQRDEDNILPYCGEWRYLFYNMAYRSPTIDQKLIKDIHALDTKSAMKFLEKASDVLLLGNSLWSEYSLVMAITELRLTNQGREIFVSSKVFDRIKANLSLPESEKKFRLKSGIRLISHKTKASRVSNEAQPEVDVFGEIGKARQNSREALGSI